MDNELLLRTGVFMACILTGIIVMKKSKGILPKLIITAVYIVAVLYYTLFSRMGIHGVAAVVDSGLSGVEHLRTWKDIVRDIFIMRVYDRTGAAFLFNILLLVPLGYILPALNKRFDGIVKMVLVGVIVSLIIETLQEFSGLGMFDVLDVVANVLGVAIGFGLTQAMDFLEECIERRV